MVVNSEMYTEEYRKRFGLVTVKIPLFMLHSNRRKDSDIVEMEEIVVGTNTMDSDDWKMTYIFSWAVQCFHFLGITQLIALYMHGRYDMCYRTFYELLILFAMSDRSVLLKREIGHVGHMLDNVLKGEGFDQFIEGCGDTR
jgi:hypothetical protein